MNEQSNESQNGQGHSLQGRRGQSQGSNGSEAQTQSPSQTQDNKKLSPDDPSLGVGGPVQRVVKKSVIRIAIGLLFCLSAVALLVHKHYPLFGGSKLAGPQIAAEPPAQQMRTAPEVFSNGKKQRRRRLQRAAAKHQTRPSFLTDKPREHQAAAGAEPKEKLSREAERAELMRELAQEQRDKAPPPSVFFSTSSTPWASRKEQPSSVNLGALAQLQGNLVPGANPAAALGGGFDPNGQASKRRFLETSGGRSHYVRGRLESPRSEYEIMAPTSIAAALVGGINSDLPGPVSAMVTERYFDTVTGKHLLIPQGTRLLAEYDSMVAYGQERVMLCWQRMIFPNGKSIDLECMPATDVRGMAGLADEVDHHWDRILSAAGMSTILSLGVQAAAGRPSGVNQAPSLLQSAGANAANEINSLGQGVVRRTLMLQPTITVREGFPVLVRLTKDLPLEPYVEHF